MEGKAVDLYSGVFNGPLHCTICHYCSSVLRIRTCEGERNNSNNKRPSKTTGKSKCHISSDTAAESHYYLARPHTVFWSCGLFFAYEECSFPCANMADLDRASDIIPCSFVLLPTVQYIRASPSISEGVNKVV